MEPFGLFQFLQNLLNAQSNLGEAPPPQSAENSPTETPSPQPKTEAPPPVQNAAATFLENHERRARRRK